MLRILCVLVLTAGFAVAEDSPLVALQKRTNKKAPKSKVITNETVSASKGRLSVATGDTTAPSAAPAGKQEAAKTGATTAAPATGQPGEIKVIPTPLPPTYSPQPKYPATSARTIEPASSARTIEPQSSARTIAPTSGAQTIAPTSTVQSIQPASSAQNVQPQRTNVPPPQ